MNIKKLIEKMTLKEKLEQLTQLNAGFFDKNAGTEATGPLGELGLNTDNLKGTGSVLNFQGPDSVKALQKQHLDDDPNKIPMMFMMDVIHGCRTIYPVPLGLSASFDPQLVKDCCAMAAKEAAAEGINVTFAPMADLARDARWGRVMESTGEDPYLNCLYSRAAVEGFQGDLHERKNAARVLSSRV